MAARVTPYGLGALYLDLDLERAPDRAARTHAAAAALRAALGEREGAVEVVVGAGAILVAGVDPALDAGPAIEAAIEAAAADPAGRSGAAPRTHVIPVVYDGPDLAEVAAMAGASVEEVIAWHTGAEVVVELLGFLPGFAYCSGLPPRLVLPRRSTPRPSVPAGSVAVAGGFTGIYPRVSPGGWWLLGRAAGAALFDAERDPPALLAPGDRVRFARVAHVERGAEAVDAPAERQGERPDAPAIDVVAAPAGATVQDAGRPRQLARGLPPSGPLDAETHAAANLAAGNAPGAAAVEIPLGGLEIQAAGEIVISVDGEPAVRLADGERLRVPPGPVAVRYLAVRGGVAVKAQLGARATLPAARLGGLEGRPLRRGDRLPVGGAEPRPPGSEAAPPERRGGHEIEVDPGPHLDRFPPGALAGLLEGAWRISRFGDRVGVRLEGARVPREGERADPGPRADEPRHAQGPGLSLPAPMIRGAVQVTTDGTPIVLGPDHPVTGGYPVIAVVRRVDQPRLARLRPGDEVRFRLGR